MTFIPQFTKPIVSKDGVTEITLPPEKLDEIIKNLSQNDALVNLMIEYINAARSDGSKISEDDEIKMRKDIFPHFDSEIMGNYPNYIPFISEISEEMFQRIESGILEIQK